MDTMLQFHDDTMSRQVRHSGDVQLNFIAN